MPSVYVETTVVSYLAADPSRDLIVAAHQQITHGWWRTARDRFDLYISDAVVNEIAAGRGDMAERRLALIEDLNRLGTNKDVDALVDQYRERLGLTGRARGDVVHFAFAVAFELDFLVTWNCSHIANGEVIRKLVDADYELGRHTPLVITPDSLLTDAGEESP